MHQAVEPMLLGSGEHLLTGLDLQALGYRCTESVAGEKAVHFIISRVSRMSPRTEENRADSGRRQ